MNAKPKPRKPLIGKKAAFLVAFRRTCCITKAAAAVKMDRHNHYVWMDTDPAYRAEFEGSIEEAAGALEAVANELSVRGHFEPLSFKGKYCYATRKRTMCQLADGTTAFEDELPKKHPKVVQRKTVVTADGEQLGTFRKDSAMLARLLAAHLPRKYGTARTEVTGALEVTTADDAKRALFLKLTGLCLSPATPGGDSEP